MEKYSKSYYERYKNFNHLRLKRFIIENLKHSFIFKNGLKVEAIVDIGCGTSRLIGELRNYSDIAIGVDISFDAIKIASKCNNSSYFVAGDILRLPIKTNSCDICICLHVVEHINETDLLLKEMCRIMRENGKVIFLTPNRRWTEFLPAFLKDSTHVNEFTICELKRLISSYFAIEDVRCFSMFTSFGIFNSLLNKLLKPDIYISAIKK